MSTIYWVRQGSECFLIPLLLRAARHTIPILQMKKVRYREVEYLVQGHTTIKWQNQDLNPGSLVPDPILLTYWLHF